MSRIASIRPLDLFNLAWSSLRRNQLRSLLTIGAIAVGISVMVYLISLGFGLERITLGNVEQSSSLLSLTVHSGSEKLQPLNLDALSKIKAVTGVKQALPEMIVKGQMSLNSTQAAVTIIGVDPNYLSISDDAKLQSGNYFRPDDEDVMVVSVGFLKLFELDQNKNPLVTFSLLLDQTDFPKSNPADNLAVTGVVNSQAVVAYLPLPYLEKLVGTDALPNFDNVKVIVPSLDNIQPVGDALRAYGFRVETVSDTVDQIKNVFRWIQIILASLGLVAIGVASIGMFNTLTISLLERTREIGIMKALGVKSSDINRLFLTEALLIGLLGGVSGIVLALIFQQLTLFALSVLASLVQGIVPTLFYTTWMIPAAFMVFAIAISLITGVYPARRAMKLRPIDAIRYE